ncbi:MAG: PLDc N-terminal domain-containing protein [Armatimonadota bacterium]|nr:PLDc N-terminal domain-containing protein [Armatimonadota bacterium]
MCRIGAQELVTILIILGFFIVAALPLAFWIWMIVDCATKEPSEGNEKLIWILIILLTGPIGAIIYFFARRSKRIAKAGG